MVMLYDLKQERKRWRASRELLSKRRVGSFDVKVHPGEEVPSSWLDTNIFRLSLRASENSVTWVSTFKSCRRCNNNFFFVYDRWEKGKRTLVQHIIQKIAVDDIIDVILCNEENWNRITQLAEKYVWATI